MNSRWFLLGAVVGFLMLLFKVRVDLGHGLTNTFAAGTSAATPGVAIPVAAVAASGGCGCGGSPSSITTPTTLTAPAAANLGGGGFQYAGTPSAAVGSFAGRAGVDIAGTPVGTSLFGLTYNANGTIASLPSVVSSSRGVN